MEIEIMQGLKTLDHNRLIVQHRVLIVVKPLAKLSNVLYSHYTYYQ